MSDALKVRLSLEVSIELFNLLDSMAQRMASSKADVLRKAIALYEIAINAKRNGQQLAILDADDRTVVKLIVI